MYVSPYARCVLKRDAVHAVAAGDVNNARIVFKNAVANELVYKSPEIWEYFMEFETEHGTVQEMFAVESQRRVALKEKIAPRVAMDSLLMLRTRYKSMGLWPCTKEQQGYIEGLQGINTAGRGEGMNGCVLCCTVLRCVATTLLFAKDAALKHLNS